MKLPTRSACITAAFFTLLGCFAGEAFGQQQRGVPAIWDVRSMLRLLVVQTERYQKAVAEADTAAWTAKSGSGSDAYAPHKEALLKQIGYLTQMTNQLYAHPEKLPLALDVLFRLQSLENATLALAEGAQKYDAVKVFDELHRLMEQNIDLRTQLRDYVMDLSVTKETEYTIAEQEAHRCQAVLNRNPLAPEPKTNPAGKK